MDKVVIKIGTESILNENGVFDIKKPKVATMIENIQSFINIGIGVILVSSGAVGLGKKEFKKPEGLDEIKYAQACAGIGQTIMISEYRKAFNELGTNSVSQLLLTHWDMKNACRSNSLKETLNIYLDNGIIPIINENDALTKEELLKVGKEADNDRLSLYVAKLVKAKTLMIITNTNGVYNKNPNESGAFQIPYIANGDFSNIEFSSKSEDGTGGMESKVAVAKSAICYGINVHILDGIHSTLIEHYYSMQSGGTVIKAL
ncbi:MAG: glutamate 5-kinase [Candidatus Gracilibacteria bacterium]|nr:glutamate 5-kinase [Candidatus Gracilibacteria bacterium]MDD2908355.1 glutamate 5-kinase [Candidatus Gracilibacteria bacterium]